MHGSEDQPDGPDTFDGTVDDEFRAHVAELIERFKPILDRLAET
jgi:hypothetical protein